MADEQKPVRIIPREKAVFRLDKNGIWYADDEKFKNPKIIKHFHSAIKRDKDGFFLQQEHRDYIEKVYFPYEDTALFVTRIIAADGLILRTNTAEQIKLEPGKLLIKNDDLYIRKGEDLVKFNENALLALFAYLHEAGDQYAIDIDGQRHLISRTE